MGNILFSDELERSEVLGHRVRKRRTKKPTMQSKVETKIPPHILTEMEKRMDAANENICPIDND